MCFRRAVITCLAGFSGLTFMSSMLEEHSLLKDVTKFNLMFISGRQEPTNGGAKCICSYLVFVAYRLNTHLKL